jgi:hypothetical protein
MASGREWTKERHERAAVNSSGARESERTALRDRERLANALLASQQETAGERERAEGYRARLARYEEPVDVDGEVERVARAFYVATKDEHPWPALAPWEQDEYKALFRPLVTEKAQFQREVETWVARVIEGTDTIARERREHAAEIARLERENEKTREAMNEWAESDARARAEIARLKSDHGEAWEHALRAIPLDELGALNFGQGTCASWEEHREEHEAANYDDKPHTTYTIICEGAERVRERLIIALSALESRPAQPLTAERAPISLSALAADDWDALRALFVKLLDVDHAARHLSEEAGQDGDCGYRVTALDFNYLQTALDAFDPSEGHDEQVRGRAMALFEGVRALADADRAVAASVSIELSKMSMGQPLTVPPLSVVVAPETEQDHLRRIGDDWQQCPGVLVADAPQPLTEAEARAWADGINRTWHASDKSLSLLIKAALLAASSGAIPPEVRAVTDCECDPALPARDRCGSGMVRCNAGIRAGRHLPTDHPSDHAPQDEPTIDLDPSDEVKP